MKLNRIYNENCLDTMKKMPDNFVDLVVTSPPYDNLREYNGYSFPFEEIAQELFRVLKDGGVIVWVVGDATVNGSETGSSFRQALYFKECGFRLFDTMIWEKTGRIPTQDRYYNVFEYMFVLSKGKPKTLNLLCDHKAQQGGRTQRRDKVINKGNNKKSSERFTRNTFSRRPNIWKIHIGKNETNHPAVFPEQLAHDHIVSWSNPNELVYDPFMGSGTTAKMSVVSNRKFIGSEISIEYCQLIEDRLSTLIQYEGNEESSSEDKEICLKDFLRG